ncbi:MAG: 5-(carboxyamino)imidazole ribonucleotide synthase, partial [Bradymonadia bacterium]
MSSLTPSDESAHLESAHNGLLEFGRSREISLGILGDGQLARMLAGAAIRLGIQVTIVSPTEDASALISGVRRIRGRTDDPVAVAELAACCDVITAENEFLDAAMLTRTLAAVAESAALHPHGDAIAVAQDKLVQKHLFEQLSIARSPAYRVRSSAAVADTHAASRALGGDVVLKWSRFGYDGRGTLLLPAADSTAEAARLINIERFCLAAAERGTEVFAERMVFFDCEVSQVGTRGEDGTMVFLPLVISLQESGVCREVWGPATDFGVPDSVQDQTRAALKAVGDAIGLVGTFAIEFFLCGDELVANEMAPRVHNTGHWSRFGTETDQFELHVRAVCGLPLEALPPTRPFVMRNLLGPASTTRLDHVVA